MQIDILEHNIEYISEIFGEMTKREKELYMIEWIQIHGKTWRNWYNKKVIIDN